LPIIAAVKSLGRHFSTAPAVGSGCFARPTDAQRIVRAGAGMARRAVLWACFDQLLISSRESRFLKPSDLKPENLKP
jgi:hypothetical protein